MEFFKYLVLFLFFSIFGWILEFIYRSLYCKKIINPGFMSGCVLPLYGCGALILNFACKVGIGINPNLKVLIIFLSSTILLTLLELLFGIILFNFFHMRLWDYTKRKLNYKGYICLHFSLIWGLLGLLYYYFFNPIVDIYILKVVNNFYGVFFLGLCSGIFLIDLCVSLNLLSRIIRYANIVKDTIDLEKLKVDVVNRITSKRALHILYPYVLINRFLKSKLVKFKEAKK